MDSRICVISNASFNSSSNASMLDLVRKKGLVVVKGGKYDKKDYSSFLQSWGDAVDHPFLPQSEPELGFAVLSRDSDRVGGFIYGGAWHQNLMFLDAPPDITLLYAHQVSDSGNFTAFVDLSQVAEWYSEGARAFLSSLRAIHSTEAPDSPQNALPSNSLRPEARRVTQSAVHNCYIFDEIAEISWPFIMSNYVVCFEGWKPHESMPLVNEFRRFAIYEEFVIRHYWEPDDLLIWDNRRYMHRATITHKTGVRTMWRGDLRVGWGLTAANPH